MPPIQMPIPNPLLTGEFDAVISDPASGTPTNVIRREDAWSVHATWYLQGPVATLLDGRWRLLVALESIGPGPEMVSAPVFRGYQSQGTLSGTYPTQRMSFDAQVNFPAGSPGTAGQSSVTYKATAYLSYITPAGTPGPFAAVYDLGVIEVFDSPLAP
jgi:hypothetical protein